MKKKMAKCWIGPIGFIELVEIEIIAESKGYCMVRRKGAMPFVRSRNDIYPAAFTTEDANRRDVARRNRRLARQ